MQGGLWIHYYYYYYSDVTMGWHGTDVKNYILVLVYYCIIHSYSLHACALKHIIAAKYVLRFRLMDLMIMLSCYVQITMQVN